MDGPTQPVGTCPKSKFIEKIVVGPVQLEEISAQQELVNANFEPKTPDVPLNPDFQEKFSTLLDSPMKKLGLGSSGESLVKIGNMFGAKPKTKVSGHLNASLTQFGAEKRPDLTCSGLFGKNDQNSRSILDENGQNNAVLNEGGTWLMVLPLVAKFVNQFHRPL